MTAPVRVQLRRTKGWRMPPNTVKVDRTTKWGNPYFVDSWDGRTFRVWIGGRLVGSFVDTAYAAKRAVRHFELYIAPTLDLTPLRGLNLACWCKPGAPCHADVLLELANRPE